MMRVQAQATRGEVGAQSTHEQTAGRRSAALPPPQIDLEGGGKKLKQLPTAPDSSAVGAQSPPATLHSAAAETLAARFEFHVQVGSGEQVTCPVGVTAVALSFVGAGSEVAAQEQGSARAQFWRL
jgi:hypothetical protein